MNVLLENFEGPLDLLIHLIEKNKINIYDIPISTLTNQYLEYLNAQTFKDMDNISEFLVMAATLLEIKSKMLLPKKINDVEEIDPREQLVKRLIEYKLFKRIAENFKNTEVFVDTVMFKHPEEKLIEILIEDKIYKHEELLDGVTLAKLHDVFKDVLSRKEFKVDKVRANFGSVNKDKFTIATQAKYILNILNEKKQVFFHEIFLENCCKIEVIVTFLAMLEMMKLKVIKVIQSDAFDAITIDFFNMSSAS